MGRKHAIALSLALALGLGIGIATYPTQPTGTLVYQFMNDAGEASTITDLCDTYSGLITGTNAWCLRGDGGVVGEAMTITGNVTLENRRVCGNGDSCGGEYRQRFDATGEVATGNVASPTDAFTVCVVFTPDTVMIRRLIDKITTTNVVDFKISSTNGGINFIVYKSGGSTTLTSTNNVSTYQKTRSVACGRYDYVTDGTSIMNMWLDGVAAPGTTSSTTAVGPPVVASTPWKVHAEASNAGGTISNAFYVPAYLDDATMLAIANSALGAVVTPSIGAVPTFARVGPRYCPIEGEAEISFMPKNRPCITRGYYYTWPQTSGRGKWSEQFEDVLWTKVSSVVAVPVVTANSTDVLDPYGTNLAEKVDFPAVANAGEYSLLRQTFTGVTGGNSSSVWARTASGTATIYLGHTISTPLYYSQSCAVTTTWTRCKLNGTRLTTATWNFDIGVNLLDVSQTAKAAQTVYLFGGWTETNADTSTHYSTCTTSCPTQVDDAYTTPTPLPNPPAAVCMSADVQPNTVTGSWTESATGAAGGTIGSIGTFATAGNWQCHVRRDVSGPNSLRIYTYNASNTLVGMLTPSGTITDGGHNLRCVGTPTGAGLYMDGLNLPTDPIGGGSPSTFPTTWSATMGIGSVVSASRNLGGYMRNFKVGTGTTACN